MTEFFAYSIIRPRGDSYTFQDLTLWPDCIHLLTSLLFVLWLSRGAYFVTIFVLLHCLVFYSSCSKLFSAGVMINYMTTFSCAHILFLRNFSFHYQQCPKLGIGWQAAAFNISFWVFSLISNSRTVLVTWLKPFDENSESILNTGSIVVNHTE